MSISVIQAISPAILGLSLVVPICAGFLGRRLRISIVVGWLLFVLAFLFQDILSLMLASHFHGRDGVRAVAVDQPGTIAAVFSGWLPPLIGHFMGKGLRGQLKLVCGNRNRTNSEQDESLKP